MSLTYVVNYLKLKLGKIFSIFMVNNILILKIFHFIENFEFFFVQLEKMFQSFLVNSSLNLEKILFIRQNWYRNRHIIWRNRNGDTVADKNDIETRQETLPSALANMDMVTERIQHQNLIWNCDQNRNTLIMVL